ncbi:MAG TPA: EI24 domain-containing protein [Acetobacteraceae bacterium]|nr:EI24 domain-containing protein [Acetobacteraceae bacterium]
MEPFFLSLSRALAQLGDRSFLGVLLRSLAWSAAIFAGLHVAVVWLVDKWLNLHGLLGWAADLLGSIGASILTLWLFLPVAAAIGTLYFDRIAHAVEQRYYPGLPPPAAAPMIEQIWDGVALGLRILLLNLVALLLAILLPGVGLMLGWAVAAYAIGRGLFVAVAMRRMSRAAAESQYAHARIVVLLLGGLMALAACVPLLNLLIPVVGTAAMVHLLDLALTRQTEPYSVRNQF